MARLYFIRHGEAAAGFGEDHDPGLSDLGRKQSAEAADRILDILGEDDPLQVISSPLQRCQETSTPLCQIWGRHPRIEPGVSEIPSPTKDLSARSEWLRGLMSGTWDAGDASSREWRDYVVETVQKMTKDTVVFSHFVAINVIAGHAMGDDRVICFKPDNCSITTVDVADGEIKIVELGGEAITKVN
jgi:broad specificity phosphatase PhoE